MSQARFKLFSYAPLLLALVATCGTVAPDPRPTALLDGRWELTAIDGEPLAAGPAPTLSIDAEGRVSGDAGCNRYFGSVELQNGAARFSGIGATRRACADAARMAQEARFLEALGTITAFREAPNGRLALLSADGFPRLTFRALETSGADDRTQTPP